MKRVSSAPVSMSMMFSSPGRGTSVLFAVSMAQLSAIVWLVVVIEDQDGITLRLDGERNRHGQYLTCSVWLPGAMVARLASIANVPKGCRFESCGGHFFFAFFLIHRLQQGYSALWNSQGYRPTARPWPLANLFTSVFPFPRFTFTHGSSVTVSIKCHSWQMPSPTGCGKNSSSSGNSARKGWYSAPRGVILHVDSGRNSCSRRSNAFFKSAA